MCSQCVPGSLFRREPGDEANTSHNIYLVLTYCIGGGVRYILGKEYNVQTELSSLAAGIHYNLCMEEAQTTSPLRPA